MKKYRIEAENVIIGKAGGKLSSLLLAKNYDAEKNDPTNWYMSEKLDGVRCYWNGSNMYSRNGNLFYPPDFFKKALPKNICLDGELWTNRDDF
jgi:DNA ligase-1